MFSQLFSVKSGYCRMASASLKQINSVVHRQCRPSEQKEGFGRFVQSLATFKTTCYDLFARWMQKKILIRDVREAFHLMHRFMILNRVSVWPDCASRSCSVNTLPDFLNFEFKVTFCCLTRIVWDRRRRERRLRGEGGGLNSIEGMGAGRQQGKTGTV